ncbi:MAG: glycosyltransferase family 2 protein [Planctomycetes bacterium]|nr:glycosyltransferase family 2 protein [Planctomycetota bacterium]
MTTHSIEPIDEGPGPIDSPGGRVEVSVVIPIYNEVENVMALHSALSCALQAMGRDYEILFVDDGSTDGSREIMRRLAADDPNLRVVLFRRNYGQTAAMSAGFDYARGSTVVTMDGDLQNDPADIRRVVEKLDQGYDIVCGWRRNRKDAYATRLLPSKLANLLIRRTTGVPIHDTGCSLKAYRAWVVRSLNLYSDMHRFIAALGAGLGARIAEVPVRHHARLYGESKYGLGRIFRVVADLIVIKMLIQFAAHPIRWFGLLSLPLFLAAPFLFVLGFYKLSSTGEEIVRMDRFDSSFITAATITLLVAINVGLLGFLAELQLNVSKFFRRRISLTASEASAR